jgi:DNA repair protein RadA/Sms
MSAVKNKKQFICNSCGYEVAKWLGCCPQCGAWNTFEEGSAAPYALIKNAVSSIVLRPLTTVVSTPAQRMISGLNEWDRVAGGGIVPGSFVILTGDPGIGKSTLLLHIAQKLSVNQTVFYFSSEESLEQVKLRAERLGCLNEQLLFSDHANIDDIIATVYERKPDLIIIDSIQNCYSSNVDYSPGSIGHLKEAAFKLMRLAKEQNVAVLVTGHITKEGAMAGPKLLEHMVDAVFYLQGEDKWQIRVLRTTKNRFGGINEVGFFEMGEQGLQELANINQYLLEDWSPNPGSVLVSYIEGSRPLLLELQALTIASQYGIPQRIISGIDPKQVALIAAILEKYLHVKLSASDIFFKISGELKIKGNAADLGIALALLSSFFQQPLPAKCMAIGELSLTGHIKPVNYMGIHANEAEKFGIQTLVVAHNQKIEKTGCSVRRFTTVAELIALFE